MLFSVLSDQKLYDIHMGTECQDYQFHIYFFKAFQFEIEGFFVPSLLVGLNVVNKLQHGAIDVKQTVGSFWLKTITKNSPPHFVQGIKCYIAMNKFS